MKITCIQSNEPSGLFRVALFVCSLLVLSGCSEPAKPPTERLRLSKLALAKKDYKTAEQLAGGMPADAALYPAAMLIAGEAATRQERYNDALNFYATIASGQSSEAKDALFAMAELHRQQGALYKAEQTYRKLIASTPDNIALHERFAFLMSTTGRQWEAGPGYLKLVQSGSGTLEELSLMADLERPIERRPYLEECLLAAPDDPAVQLGLASHAFWEGQPVDAEKRLRQLLSRKDLSESLRTAANGYLGELLLDETDDRFYEWLGTLDEASFKSPQVAFVSGLWLRRKGDLESAAGCFYRCLQAAPAHRRACYQLGQVLTILKHPGAAAYSERAEKMIALSQALDNVLRYEGKRWDFLQQVSELLEQMGRYWESCAWAVIARTQFPDIPWPSAVFDRCAAKLVPSLPQVDNSFRLEARFDLTDWAKLSAQELASRRGLDPAERPVVNNSSISFIESAVGINFEFENGEDDSTPGARMFEQGGGGVAVTDVNGDGLPDLLFSQGGAWKHGEKSPAVTANTRDVLYLNQEGRQFVDVSAIALPQETGYGQGCTSADFDNDGFQDLYVANYGRNQLLLNLGDGTYMDVTEQAGLLLQEWTASVLITDLNGDSIPDIFDVNYLRGEGLIDIICHGRACSPSVFDGCPDRLLLGNGDGTFREILNACPEFGSKSLGVVTIADQEADRPSLFITNDQVANYFLHNTSSSHKDNIQLQEQALVRGVAFSEHGLPMAGMGIAAEDADGNGLTDLFVTNFADETNTLYLQDSPGIFVDATRRSGLAAPGIPYVGWGTQFLDADRDSLPDLIVTNGHVFDYRSEGGLFRMPTLFFRNLGRGQFEQLAGSQAGTCLDRELLGRGLAKLDWNKDGLAEVVISNMQDRSPLLTNTTASPGHFLNLRCRATLTSRDAVGTRIKVTTATGEWVRFVTAGDGYQASNEREVQFGLGSEDQIQSVEVLWPSGRRSLIRNPPVDVQLDLLEGRSNSQVWMGTLFQQPGSDVDVDVSEITR